MQKALISLCRIKQKGSDMSEAIKKRILALMAKTTENGCTEAEAIGAAQKVQELLHLYQLDLSDLKIKESKCTTGTYEVQQKSDPMTYYVISAISKFTDTKCWRDTGAFGFIEYKFFGLEHDVLVAEYITKICDWAIIWGGENFKETGPWLAAARSHRGRLKQDFQYGMAQRLSQRLREMKKAQEQTDIETTGRDLVVVKGAVVTEEFAKLGLSLTRSRGKKSRSVDSEAYAAGADAGNKVALNPGVGQDADRGQIGG